MTLILEVFRGQEANLWRLYNDQSESGVENAVVFDLSMERCSRQGRQYVAALERAVHNGCAPHFSAYCQTVENILCQYPPVNQRVDPIGYHNRKQAVIKVISQPGNLIWKTPAEFSRGLFCFYILEGEDPLGFLGCHVIKFQQKALSQRHLL